jgi:hypothetical protein
MNPFEVSVILISLCVILLPREHLWCSIVGFLGCLSTGIPESCQRSVRWWACCWSHLLQIGWVHFWKGKWAVSLPLFLQKTETLDGTQDHYMKGMGLGEDLPPRPNIIRRLDVCSCSPAWFLHNAAILVLLTLLKYWAAWVDGIWYSNISTLSWVQHENWWISQWVWVACCDMFTGV